MDGVCLWVEVSQDRHRSVKFVSATRDWKKKNVTWNNYVQGELPTKPPYYVEILTLAEKIGQDFDYIRVDFLGSQSQWKLGELTLYDSSEFTAYEDQQVELNYGSNWKHRIGQIISTGL